MMEADDELSLWQSSRVQAQSVGLEMKVGKMDCSWGERPGEPHSHRLSISQAAKRTREREGRRSAIRYQRKLNHKAQRYQAYRITLAPT